MTTALQVINITLTFNYLTSLASYSHNSNYNFVLNKFSICISASGSIDYSQSPIIESDEDFDLDDLLDEMPDKIRNLNKDVVPKPQNNHTPNG